jgi:hypothetical protein
MSALNLKPSAKSRNPTLSSPHCATVALLLSPILLTISLIANPSSTPQRTKKPSFHSKKYPDSTLRLLFPSLHHRSTLSSFAKHFWHQKTPVTSQNIYGTQKRGDNVTKRLDIPTRQIKPFQKAAETIKRFQLISDFFLPASYRSQTIEDQSEFLIYFTEEQM